MKLQKNTRLAIYSVLEFAGRPDELVPAAAVADRHGESPHHLAKVLGTLARAGIVEAVRGAGGGYRFAANPRRLTLLDLIVLFEPLGDQAPAADAGAVDRALGQVLGEIDETARATFGSITVATMLALVDRAGATAAGQPNGQARPAVSRRSSMRSSSTATSAGLSRK